MERLPDAAGLEERLRLLEVPMMVLKNPPAHRRGLSSMSLSLSVVDEKDLDEAGRWCPSPVPAEPQSFSIIMERC
jgi:hypothetical protein